jgi:hypothetical protein
MNTSHVTNNVKLAGSGGGEVRWSLEKEREQA